MSSFVTRRRVLQMGAAGAAVGALAIASDGAIFEANRPQLVSIEVRLPRLAASWDGFRIAQLSDLHYDDYFSVVPLRKAIEIVRPDSAMAHRECPARAARANRTGARYPRLFALDPYRQFRVE